MSACVLLEMDSEFLDIQTTFENKFKSFNELLGDDCSIFSTVSGLLKDASNVADEFAKDLKKGIADLIAQASKIFDQIKSITGGVLDTLVSQIKDALISITTAFDDITATVNDMINVVIEATKAIKTMLCDAISSAISVIPPEIVAGTVAISAVKGFNFAKDDLGKNIVGMKDVQKMSTDILNTMDVNGMKNNILNKVLDAKSLSIPKDITSFMCNYQA